MTPLAIAFALIVVALPAVVLVGFIAGLVRDCRS